MTSASADSPITRSTILENDSGMEDLILLPSSGSPSETPLNLPPRCRSAQWMNLKSDPIVRMRPFLLINTNPGSLKVKMLSFSLHPIGTDGSGCDIWTFHPTFHMNL